MNFRQVNLTLGQLKKNFEHARTEYNYSEMCSDEERFWQWEMYEAREQLDKFRQTKISEYEGRII